MEGYGVTLLDFTLRKRGMQMEYRVMQPKSRGSMQMMVETREKSPFPPSSRLLRLVESVKPFACKGLGLWTSSFDRFTEDDGTVKDFSDDMFGQAYRELRDTLDSVEIVSVVFSGGYRFICMVETIPGKRVKMRTPLISDGDDLFEAMEGLMQELGSVALEFISSAEYDVKAEARSIVERTMSAEEIEGKTDKELLLIALERIEELGAVVMYSEELEAEVNEARSERPLLEVTGADGVDEGDVRMQEVVAWADGERGYDEGSEASEEEVTEELGVKERTADSMERVDDGDRSPAPDGDEDWEEEPVVVVEEDDFM